jgi:hypothetical protein
MATRGLFGQFNAGYGEEVKLYRSSSASGGVWLSLAQVNSNNEARDLQGELINKIGEAAAHLTPAQARVLRAMLDSYLEEANEDE